jgi:integrase
LGYALKANDEVKRAKPLVNPKRIIEAFGSEDQLAQDFVRTLLLTGMRFSECLNLESRHCQELDSRGCIELGAEDTKTNAARTIWLQESPSLIPLLSERLRRNGVIREHRIWGNLTKPAIDYVKLRVIKAGCPSFTWQALRRTCGSYLTCAPGIYGGASSFNSAKRLGHSVTIAERLYVGALRGIPFEAKTLEEAMGL